MEATAFRQYTNILERLLRSDFDSVHAELISWIDPQWKEFSDYLKTQRSRACFAYFLAIDPRLGPLVPDWFVKELDEYIRLLGHKVEQFRTLAGRISEVFERSQTEYLMLKGDTVGLRFYPRDQRRHQFDIDLMVRESDLGRAVQSLAELGLRFPGKKSAVNRHVLRTKHAECLSDGSLSIDLHWALRRGPGYRFPMDQIWDSRQFVPINLRQVPTLSDEYLLVLLCLSLAHDLGRGAACLKHLIDIHYVLRHVGGQLLADDFWLRRRNEGIDRICSAALGLVEAILPGSLPGAFIPISNPFHSNQHAWQLLSNPRKSFDNSLWILRLQEIWKPAKLSCFIRQNLSHPGRIPLCSYQVTRFAYRVAMRGTMAGLSKIAG